VETAAAPAGRIDVERLFTEHAGRLLTFAHRMLGDRADAEDAVQETFLKAFRQADHFDGRSAPSTWLFAIARNTCLDRLRGRPARTFTGLEGLIGQALDGDPDDVADEVERGRGARGLPVGHPGVPDAGPAGGVRAAGAVRARRG
jgi:RNA polymerase sigma-70 factor (ECF subfamily)